MSLLDRLIAPLFPGLALSRLEARVRFDRLNAAYDGARRSRRTRNWRADSTSANNETTRDLTTLRDRSRDLVRNNPWAAAGLDMLVSYQVGTGLMPRSAIQGDTGANEAVDALWARWGVAADVARRHDINGLMAQAARTRAESGESLVALVNLSSAEMRRRNTPVPLALQLLEPDHIDGAREEAMTDGAVRQGVEIDLAGAPRAYWLLTEHPGDSGAFNLPKRSTLRVPADRMLHLYRQDRPGQVRGVPDLAPVLTRLRMLDEYEDASLQQALLQACVAAFVTSPAAAARGPLEGAEDGAGVDAAQRKTLAPGIIERLLPGEAVEFLNPSSGGPFSEFVRHQLRAVAAGYGLTYDLLSGDLTQANYSSLRAGRLAFKRRLEQTQWLLLVPRLAQPIWDAFIRAAVVAGALPPRTDGYPVEWSVPRFEMVDPNKDTAAIISQLRAGLMTWGQAVGEMGYDPRRQADEIAQWNATHDELGLILDGDSRRTSSAGGAQDARQNAAVEIAATGASTNTPPGV